MKFADLNIIFWRVASTVQEPERQGITLTHLPTDEQNVVGTLGIVPP